jgi:hypothetical protein
LVAVNLFFPVLISECRALCQALTTCHGIELRQTSATDLACYAVQAIVPESTAHKVFDYFVKSSTALIAVCLIESSF